jgi:hypothetical protein
MPGSEAHSAGHISSHGAAPLLDDSVVRVVEQVNASPDLEFNPCKGEPETEDQQLRLDSLLALVARDPALFLGMVPSYLLLAPSLK